MIGAYFTLIISILLPLAVLVYYLIKDRRLVLPYFIGALTFTVFQTLTRIPLVQGVLPGFGWFQRMSENIWLYYFFFCITAALFEEGGRYITMHLLLKRGARYDDAIAFGVGHGGIEAITLIGLSVIYTIAIGQGDQIPLYAGIERISAMSMHVCWSVLVMRSLREKRIRWLLLAFFFHFAVNYFTIALYLGASVALVEGILLAAAIGFVLYTLRMKKAFAQDSLVSHTPEDTEQSKEHTEQNGQTREEDAPHDE